MFCDDIVSVVFMVNYNLTHGLWGSKKCTGVKKRQNSNHIMCVSTQTIICLFLNTYCSIL